jgi:predicted O-linked N-acetylglucosamine transferase (SPINDLY family)
MRLMTMDRFGARGISGDRLELQEFSVRADYLAAYDAVDIALDPFPYNGGTTSLEGLWMGVPMITLRGGSVVARQGEMILQNLGLQDWIASTDAEYVATAVARSTDLQALAGLRQELRPRLLSSPLCDAARFSQNLQNAFRGIWQAHCSSSETV